jgi:cold shock protein
MTAHAVSGNRGRQYLPGRWQNRRVAKKRPLPESRVAGVVKWFDADEGWGVIVAPEVAGDCFVHFSSIQASGYRELHAGQRVCFTWEDPGYLQDGCPFRALQVWPQP